MSYQAHTIAGCLIIEKLQTLPPHSRERKSLTWGTLFQLSPSAGFELPSSPPTTWFVTCKICHNFGKPAMPRQIIAIMFETFQIYIEPASLFRYDSSIQRLPYKTLGKVSHLTFDFRQSHLPMYNFCESRTSQVWLWYIVKILQNFLIFVLNWLKYVFLQHTR